jgi:membrane protease YdiL (CAAX protease family)
VVFSIVSGRCLRYVPPVLSEKRWKLDAVARLFLAGILSMSLASLVLSAAHYRSVAPHPRGVVLGAFGGATLFLAACLVQIARPWKLETLMNRLLALMICLCAGLCLSLWAETKAGPPPPSVNGMQMLAVECAALLLFVRFLKEHDVSWVEAFGLNRRPGLAVLGGLSLGILFIPIGWSLQTASGLVMELLHQAPKVQPAVQALKDTTSWSSRLPLALVALLFAPVVEEVFFRGILYPTIKQAGFRRLALWVCAVLFGLAHLNLPTFIPLFALAVALTLLYEYMNNLLACMVAHCTFNTVNLLMFYFWERRLA